MRHVVALCSLVFLALGGVLTASDALAAPGTVDGARQRLTVASTDSFPPVNLLDERDRLTGFGRDVSDAVLGALGVEIERLHSSSWVQVLEWLDTGAADLIHDTAYTEARDAYLDFSVPILEMPEVIFVQEAQLTIHDFASLRGKTVACVRGHISHQYLEQFPEIRCHVVETPVEGVYALVAGEVDAFVYPQQIVTYYAQQLRLTNKLKVVGEPLRTLAWSMAVREGERELLAALNRGIGSIKASGEYARIYDKWFGRHILDGYSKAEVTTVSAGAVLLGLLVSALAILAVDNRRIRKARLALEQSEERYRLLVENQTDLVVKVDTEGQFLFVSPSYCRTFGMAAEDLLGKTFMPLVHEDDRRATAEALAKLYDPPYSVYLEQRAKTAEGWRWLGWQDTAVLDDAERVVAIIGVGRDITARKVAEAAQLESEQRLKVAGELAYDLIYEWNLADGKLYWFGDVDRALGYPPGAISRDAQDWLALLHPDDVAPVAQLMAATEPPLEPGPVELQYRIRHHAGHWAYWNDRCLPMLDAQGRLCKWIGVCKDVSIEQDHQRQLEYIAHYDAVTDLPNRVLLMQRLAQAMASAKADGALVALVYLDLDGFKRINDNCGHSAGDHFLARVAKRLREALRDSDTIARLGGDEFVAILPSLQATAECIPILTRLLRAAADQVRFDGHVLHVSASMGVSFYPQAEEVDADLLLRQADQALYQAKLQGKNRYQIFDAAQDRSLRGRQQELARIRKALGAGEFELVYQPHVDMRAGTVAGVEALLRWRHPERGLLAPSEFLPLMDAHPLIVRLGDWVIATALGQMQEWRAAGLDLQVSVNVAARQLQDPKFVSRLKALFDSHPGVSPRRLRLEVLESAAIDDLTIVSRIMQDCAALGVRFALDDFGTGYSSLTYLTRLPVSSLKLDQTFVHGLLDDPDDLIILEGVLRIAAGLQRDVIAEGVETPEQGELLLKIGCDLAQGFGIARPMPAAQVPEWCRTWAPYASWQNQHPVSQADLPLLFASISHRAWVRALDDYLRYRAPAAPPLGEHDCGFGHWLAQAGEARYGDRPLFREVVALHDAVHRIGTELCALRVDGRQERVLAGIGGLKDASKALIRHIDDMLSADALAPAPVAEGSRPRPSADGERSCGRAEPALGPWL